MTELRQILNTKQKVPDFDGAEEILKLATNLGFPVQKIFEVYDKDEDCIITIINSVGTYIKDKVQNIALLTLFGYKLFFGQEEVLSQEIRRNVTENKITLNNFAKHLDELSPKFLRKPRFLRGSETPYRLTRLGENKARDLIKKILVSPATTSNPNETNTSSIKNLLDNSELWSACKVSFGNEEYWDACSVAFRHLEIKIREKCELTAEAYGVDLVTKAFSPNNGLLKIPSCAARAEEEGFFFITRGIMQFHRNAKVHRKESMRERDAIKIICYVDYLLDILKTAEKRTEF